MNTIWQGLHVTKLLITQSSPPHCYLVPLGQTYLPQRTILKHPKHMFLLQCARPTFIPIPHWQNYTFVHFKLHIFWQQRSLHQ